MSGRRASEALGGAGVVSRRGPDRGAAAYAGTVVADGLLWTLDILIWVLALAAVAIALFALAVVAIALRKR